jgi:hypothetical protein
VKAKLWSGIFCSCTFLIAQTQQPPPAQPPPTPPPSAPATPTAPKPTIQREETPLKPQASPDRDTGGDALSIEPFYWMLTSPNPIISKAHGSNFVLPGAIDLTGNAKFAMGAIVTIPTGKENSLEFTYFRMQTSAFPTLGQDSIFESNEFPPGDLLHISYKLQTMKLSWNYLTYPFPSNGAKFRLKTLWEVQYVNADGLIEAPLDVNTTATDISKSIILPTLGLGIEYHPSKHFRLEWKGSGFGIPHHADIWDTEASAVIRTRRIELLVGGRAYHYKTSPQGIDQFFTQTLWGPYGGLRFIWR